MSGRRRKPVQKEGEEPLEWRPPSIDRDVLIDTIKEEDWTRARHGVNDAFLDLKDGSVRWVWREPDVPSSKEEQDELLRFLELEPERFVRIPYMTHGDHHEVLRRHLEEQGRLAEYDGSIGRWRKQLENDDDYYAFEEVVGQEAERRMRSFLEEHGLDEVSIR